MRPDEATVRRRVHGEGVGERLAGADHRDQRQQRRQRRRALPQAHHSAETTPSAVEARLQLLVGAEATPSVLLPIDMNFAIDETFINERYRVLEHVHF